MPLQATSGAASYDAFGGGAAAVIPYYIEDMFSCFLYTGNATARSIVNNIDISGNGGLVWTKSRSLTGSDHFFVDTDRGATKFLNSNSAAAQVSTSDITAFNSTGYALNADINGGFNNNGATFASWTFRKQPKFFDVVTYTGNGTLRTIAHNLGSVPGCVIVKRTDTTGDWYVWHRSLTTGTNGNTLYLNNTNAYAGTGNPIWSEIGSLPPANTSTTFQVGSGASNTSGGTYVAYLFAHDAGGFGLTGTDNVISCGSAANGNSLVTLGYEPQWVLIKGSQGSTAVGDDWLIADNMRGMVYSGNTPYLAANKSSAENYGGGGGPFIKPTATGFQLSGLSGTGPFVYIAIRRGPMKVPTDATKVFKPISQTYSNGSLINTGFTTDLFHVMDTAGGNQTLIPRLTVGALNSSDTNAESAYSSYVNYGSNVGVTLTGAYGGAPPISFHGFQRAPSFFDVVCYTGTGTSGTAIPHNLTVVPELIISKARSTTNNWLVWATALGSQTAGLLLNTTDAVYPSLFASGSSPTSSNVYINYNVAGNSSVTYVAYLFATCAGVSKVGSYTGTGTTQAINCGFTAGSRLVLIKRTDSTGDWYVWDSARGIIAGNDPYLLLNSTAAEVTSTDYIDTASTGFEISSTAPAAINANGGSFIFLAIA